MTWLPDLRSLVNRVLLAVSLIAPVGLSLAYSSVEPTVAEARGGSVYVRGYVRKDGTYVQPYYRSAPDGNFYNNWSTKGNINPYTGVPGTKVSPPPGYGDDVHVEGYYRSDGTYVPPHYRSAPDGDPSNNWSTQGNVNPYTGEPGSRQITASPGPVDAARELPRPVLPPVFSLQIALSLVGHDPGPPDGVGGPRTTKAFLSYARSKGLLGQPVSMTFSRLANEIRAQESLAAESLDSLAETSRRSGH